MVVLEKWVPKSQFQLFMMEKTVITLNVSVETENKESLL
jgi:hypothetical protein